MSSPSETAVRVLIVDDHTLFAEGTVSLLKAEPRILAVGIARNGGECLALLPETMPDVLLLDIGLPDMSGMDLIRQIRAAAPRVKILMLTGLDPTGFIQKSMNRGASGFLIKECTTEEMIGAILTVHEGGVYLSERLEAYLREESDSKGTAESGKGGVRGTLTLREIKIVELISRGLQNREIAASLGISIRTVEFHVGNILSKVGASSRLAAALKWGRLDKRSKNRGRKK